MSSTSFFCPSIICWKHYSFLIEFSWHSCWKSIDKKCKGSLSRLYSIDLCVYFYASTRAIIVAKALRLENDSFPILFFFKTVWITLSLSHCHRNYRISVSISTERQLGCWRGLLCAPSRFSRVRLFETPWTIARQAPLSMGFSRQEYWSGLPYPSPGINPVPLMSAALIARFFTTSATWEARGLHWIDMCQFGDYCHFNGFPDDSVGKEFACNAGDTRDEDSIPGQLKMNSSNLWSQNAFPFI